MTSQILSIAICTHNRADDVLECLTALAPQLMGTAIEVVIIDSGSSQEHKVFLETYAVRFKFVKLKRLDQPGIAHARNAAVNEASTEWLAYLDDDAVPSPDWLENALRLVSVVPDNCAIIAGAVYPIFRDRQTPILGRRWLQMLSLVKQNGESDQTGTASAVSANMIFRRSYVSSAGGFSTDLGRYGTSLLSGEEKLLQEKLVSAGWRIWCSDKIVAGHKISAERLTSKWIEKRAYWDGVSDRRIDALINRSPGYFKLLKAAVSIAILSPLQFVAPAKHELPIRLRYNLGWMRESLRLIARPHPDPATGLKKIACHSNV